MSSDPPAPTPQETTAHMMQAMIQHLPDLMQVTNREILPHEQAKLATAQEISPEIAALNAQIYDTVGRRLNTIGSEIAQENAMRQAQTDLDVLQGPGRDLVRIGKDVAYQYDPEYFDTRASTAAGLAELFKPSLTGGEREEVQRSLNRENIFRGTHAQPSAMRTVENAMTFGNAARNRLQQAVSQATQALPTFRSNVDVFQQATGRPSMVNTGENRFMDVNTAGYGQAALQQSGQLMNQIGQNQRTAMNINANRRDGLDRAMQVGSLVNAFNPFARG